MFQPRFFRIAALLCGLTALTTLCIHLLPDLWSGATAFDDRAALYRHPGLRLYLCIVIVHCLMVVVSTFAIGVANFRIAPARMSLGFLGYLLFACTELLRTSVNIVAVNRYWRPGYLNAGDPAVKDYFRENLSAMQDVSVSLFLLFGIGFFLGNALYGAAFVQRERFDRVVGVALLTWCALSLPGLIDAATGSQLARYFGWVGPAYQPLARALLAVWLWREGWNTYVASARASAPVN